MMFTMGHELTHFIKKWSPEKFKIFGDFLIEQYGKHNISVDAMIKNKIAQLNTTDVDYAYEELVADACESMLVDSNAVEKLVMLNQKDNKKDLARGYFMKGDTHTNIGKIAEFMRRCFPSYTPKEALGNYFGKNLYGAVKEFQRRTGLEVDGNIGPITLAELKKYGFRE